MNENLNLVEILKDCPKGTKLYSTAFGDVYFYGISDNKEYPIGIAVAGNSDYRTLTCDGKLWRDYGGECILFPSKEQRDWSKFTAPWYKKEKKLVEHKFNNGDIVTISSGSQIFILQKAISGNIGYCYTGYDFKRNEFFVPGRLAFDRLATEEEKQKLFRAIKNNGYKWNAETNTLDKLIKPKFKVGDKIVNRVNVYMGDLSHQDVISEITEDKYILKDGGYIHIKNQDIWELANDKKNRFDPKTLKPFDKVLARDTYYSNWRGTLFSHYIKKDGALYSCVTVGEVFSVCIPYNEDTKHLVGTTEEAPEYYRYWED